MLKCSGGLQGLALLLFCMVCWAAQASGQVHATADPVEGGAGPLGTLPATFVGDLPCADCPGIRHQLGLFPEQAFFLRLTSLGKGDDASFDDIGSWTMASDRRTLVLSGGREAPLQFAIQDANTLRQLDLEGREIASSLPQRVEKDAGPAATGTAAADAWDVQIHR